MNKFLSLCLVTLISQTAFGQTGEPFEQELPVNEESLIEYTDVVQVNGATKDELYSRAREWFVTRYNSVEDVLQMDDKESGKLIGKAFKDIMIGLMGISVKKKMYYTIGVYFKDGRYKYSVTNIEYQGYPDKYNNYNAPRRPAEPAIIDQLYKKNGKPRSMNKQCKEGTIKSTNALIADLKDSMTKSNGLTDEDDDW